MMCRPQREGPSPGESDCRFRELVPHFLIEVGHKSRDTVTHYYHEKTNSSIHSKGQVEIKEEKSTWQVFLSD